MAKKAASAPAPEPAAQPEQHQAPAPEPGAPAADNSPPTLAKPAPPIDVEPLATYAARIEEAGQPLAVCEITHPDAVDGTIHVGKYAGIRLVHGNVPTALLSDGSTI